MSRRHHFCHASAVLEPSERAYMRVSLLCRLQGYLARKNHSPRRILLSLMPRDPWCLQNIDMFPFWLNNDLCGVQHHDHIPRMIPAEWIYDINDEDVDSAPSRQNPPCMAVSTMWSAANMPQIRCSFPGTGTPARADVVMGLPLPPLRPNAWVVRTTGHVDTQPTYNFMTRTFAEEIGLRVQDIDTSLSGSVFEVHDRPGGPYQLSYRHHVGSFHGIERIVRVPMLLSKTSEPDRCVLADFIIIENGIVSPPIDFVLDPSFARSLKHWVHDAMCPDPLSQSFARGLYKQPAHVVFVPEYPEALTGTWSHRPRGTRASDATDSAELSPSLEISWETSIPPPGPITASAAPSFTPIGSYQGPLRAKTVHANMKETAVDAFNLFKCEYGLRAAPSIFSPDFSYPCGPSPSPTSSEPCGAADSAGTRTDAQQLDNLLPLMCKPGIIPQEPLTIATFEHAQPTTRRVTRSSSVMGSLVSAPRRASSQDSTVPGAEPSGTFALQAATGARVPPLKPAPTPPSSADTQLGQPTNAAVAGSRDAPSASPDRDPEDDPPDGDDEPGGSKGPAQRRCRWCHDLLATSFSWEDHNRTCTERQPDLPPEYPSGTQRTSREIPSAGEPDTSLWFNG